MAGRDDSGSGHCQIREAEIPTSENRKPMNEEIKIESGIPIPDTKNRGELARVLKKLAVGESFKGRCGRAALFGDSGSSGQTNRPRAEPA